MKKYEHIDFRPPAGAAEEAAKGLEWRSEYGRGGTEVGVQRAKQLKNRQNISPETIRRMVSFFARHGVNEGKNLDDNNEPTAWRIAWALWGGNPGRAWCNKVMRQMEAADRKKASANIAGISRDQLYHAAVKVADYFGFDDGEIAFWQCNAYSQAVAKVAKYLGIRGVKLVRVMAKYQHPTGDIDLEKEYRHMLLKFGQNYVDFTIRQLDPHSQFPYNSTRLPKYMKKPEAFETEDSPGSRAYIEDILKELGLDEELADSVSEAWMDPVSKYYMIEYGGSEFSPEQLKAFDEKPSLTASLSKVPSEDREIRFLLRTISGQRRAMLDLLEDLSDLGQVDVGRIFKPKGDVGESILDVHVLRAEKPAYDQIMKYLNLYKAAGDSFEIEFDRSVELPAVANSIAKLILKDYGDYAKAVAAAYEAAPVISPEVVDSYRSLASHTKKMFYQLLSRFDIEFREEDSYRSFKELKREVQKTGLLKVYKGGESHPVWTPEENWMFRAVHDLLGHLAGSGHSFSLRGELAAYNQHLKIIPSSAVPALFSEVVGQVCYYYVNKRYAAQKACYLHGFDFYNIGSMEQELAVAKANDLQAIFRHNSLVLFANSFLDHSGDNQYVQLAEDIIGVCDVRWNASHDSYEITAIKANSGFGMTVVELLASAIYPESLITDRTGRITDAADRLFSRMMTNEYLDKEKIPGAGSDTYSDYKFRAHSGDLFRKHKSNLRGEMETLVIEEGDAFLRHGMQEIYGSSGDDIEDELRAKYHEYLAKGPKGFPYLDIFDLKDRDAIELKLVEIMPEHRGKGIGRKLMKDLTDWADRNNRIIVLSPSEIKTNKLIKWYKEFDFLENKNRNKDFRFMNRMIRYPKGLTRSKWIDFRNDHTAESGSKGAHNLNLKQCLEIKENQYRSRHNDRDYEPEEIDARIIFLQSRKDQRNEQEFLRMMDEAPDEYFERYLSTGSSLGDATKMLSIRCDEDANLPKLMSSAVPREFEPKEMCKIMRLHGDTFLEKGNYGDDQLLDILYKSGHPYVLKKNGQLYALDGQHRINTAIMLGSPLDIMVVDGKDLDFITDGYHTPEIEATAVYPFAPDGRVTVDTRVVGEKARKS